MKIMKKLSVFLMGIFALAMMASCSSSDDSSTGGVPSLKEGITKTLTLKIAGNSTTGRASAAVAAGSEATINELIVVIYDNDLDKIEGISKVTSPTVTSNTITQTVHFNTTKPSVFVLANVPMNSVDAALGQNLTSFKDCMANLDVTAAGDGLSQVTNHLPMVGSTSTLSAGASENSFTANVTLHRMVARVVLNNITTNFSNGESFTVTDVFMKNVNSESSFMHSDIAAEAGTFATLKGFPTVQTLVDGLMADPNNKTWLHNSYATTPWSNTTPAYFYVFPNNNTVFAQQTQIVIKGKYIDNDNPSPGVDKYYVAVVNRAPDAEGKITYTDNPDAGTGAILGNRIYEIAVTITGEGQAASDVEADVDPIPAGQNNVELTVNVAEWPVAIRQSVKF
jgi:hypothetical protein